MDRVCPPAKAPLPLEAAGGAGADALIELLHRLQQQPGWLDPETLRQAARQLQLPLSHVYGVASFYHLFQLQQPSPHRCEVCLGTACFVRGGLQLAARLATRLGVELDAPRGAGDWSLQRLGCLGACGQAPVLVVDGRLLTHVPLEGAELEARLRAAGLPEVAGTEGRAAEARGPAAVAQPAIAAEPQP